MSRYARAVFLTKSPIIAREILIGNGEVIFSLFQEKSLSKLRINSSTMKKTRSKKGILEDNLLGK
jgi:hypothetical protein